MIRAFLQGLGPGSVLRRFPVPSWVALLGAAYAGVMTPRIQELGDWFLWPGVAFLAALAAQLWVQTQFGDAQEEGRAGGRPPHVAAAVAVLAVIALAGVQKLSAEGARWPYLLHPYDAWFLLGALVVLLPVVPLLGRRFSIEAQWRFGLNVLLAWLAFAAGLAVMNIGLLLAGSSLWFLLGRSAVGLLNLGERLLFMLPGVAALLFLGVLPDRAHAPDETEVQRGPARLVQFLTWVAVPLLVLHGAILNIYAVKILLHWELPRGGVGWMVGTLAFFGTIVWLLAQAPVLRGQGGRLLTWFVHRWWWLLAAPFALLLIGVWRRIADYGVTPPRYLLAEMAIWMAFALALWLWRGARASNRMLTVLAGVLLLFGALAGPYSARNMSVRSQLANLHAMLADKGVLDAQGTIAKPVPAGTWTKAEKRRVRSIVETMGALAAEERLLAMVRPPLRDTLRRQLDKAASYNRQEVFFRTFSGVLGAKKAGREKNGSDNGGAKASDRRVVARLETFTSNRLITFPTAANMLMVVNVYLSDRSNFVQLDRNLGLELEGGRALALKRYVVLKDSSPSHARGIRERWEVIWRLPARQINEAVRKHKKKISDGPWQKPVLVSMPDGGRMVVRQATYGECLAEGETTMLPCIEKIRLDMLIPLP